MTFPQQIIHGWVYVPSGQSWTSLALAGFSGYYSTGYSSYVALSISGGNWAVIQRYQDGTPQLLTTATPATLNQWHEFEIMLWSDNTVSLMIDRTRLFQKETLPLSAGFMFQNDTNAGINNVVGVIDFAGTAPLTVYYDDVSLGSVSFWSCDGWGASSCPFNTTSPSLSLAASPSTITSGGSSMLSWSSSNVSSCTAPWTTSTATVGSQSVSPSFTTTYTMTCTGTQGATSQSTTVTVSTPDLTSPSIPTSLSASAISSSQINLSWTASTDTGGSGLAGYKVYRAGTQIAISPITSYSNTALTPLTSYTYTVSAYDNASPANVSSQSSPASATTLASPTPPPLPPPAPTLSLTSTPSSITAGGSSTIAWSSTNTASCSAPWTSSTATSGSQTVTPLSTTTYTMTCTGLGGTITQSVTVTVSIISSAKFIIRDRVKVSSLATPYLNVRPQPSLSSKQKSCKEYPGNLGTITQGPVTGSGYTWWQVKWDDKCSGWSVENYLDKVTIAFLAPFLQGETGQAPQSPVPAQTPFDMMTTEQKQQKIQELQAQLALILEALQRLMVGR